MTFICAVVTARVKNDAVDVEGLNVLHGLAPVIALLMDSTVRQKCRQVKRYPRRVTTEISLAHVLVVCYAQSINNAAQPALIGVKMSIDNLTFGELKQIAAMFPGQQAAQSKPHPFVGRYVICRCYSAGVHAGILVSQEGGQAILKDSRRLWSWKNNGGVALSGLAVNGINDKESKIDVMLPEIALTGVIETIPTSDVCKESIHAAK